MLLKLLGLPVSLPVDGLRFCLERIAEMAEAELYDESVVHEQLLLLQLQLEEGELSEEEYTEREAVLMERLREIRAYHEQRAREEAEVQGDDERPAARRVIVESQLEGGEQ